MDKIKVNNELRIARALARAEAAAARAEQIVALLEAKLAPTEGGGADAQGAAPTLESSRLAATEGAIIDLGAMMASLVGGDGE